MYVKPNCPYCENAREHLAREGETGRGTGRDSTALTWKSELMGYTNNRGTVPTIVWSDGRRQVGFPPGRG